MDQTIASWDVGGDHLGGVDKQLRSIPTGSDILTQECFLS